MGIYPQPNIWQCGPFALKHALAMFGVLKDEKDISKLAGSHWWNGTDELQLGRAAKKFGVDIPFPIIEDLSMQVAHDYGMIQPGASDTSTVRATFFIDPESKIRALVYYPMTNGRSVDEFLRLLEALQTSDAHAVATPEGWKPGEKVIVPTPATTTDADARLKAGYETADWYFSKTDLKRAPKKAAKRTKR